MAKLSSLAVKQIQLKSGQELRARVISHALKDLIMASDKVIIMGHKNPDMDSIGSSIGIYKVAQMNQKGCLHRFEHARNAMELFID